MNDKENCARSNFAKRDIPLLFLVMDNIPYGQGIRVLEHKFCRLKIDIMLCEILLVLLLVKLKFHRIRRQSQDSNMYIQVSICCIFFLGLLESDGNADGICGVRNRKTDIPHV